MWKPSLGGSVRHGSGVTRWKPCLLAPPGVQSCFLWGKCGQNCTGVQIIEPLGTQMKGFWPHLLSDYCYYNFLIDQYSPTDENDLQESQRGTLALEERPRDWGAESPLVVEERTAVEQRAVTWLACWASSLIGVHVLILKYVCHRVELDSPSLEHPCKYHTKGMRSSCPEVPLQPLAICPTSHG